MVPVRPPRAPNPISTRNSLGRTGEEPSGLGTRSDCSVSVTRSGMVVFFGA